MVTATPTIDRLRVAQEAEGRIRDAADLEELRGVFVQYCGLLGWRALCRMWALRQGAAKALRVED